jgi:phosphoesterase RecJ-like protein
MLNLEQQIARQIEKSQSILIVLPTDRDSDAIASSLALNLFLKGLHKTVELAGTKLDQVPEPLAFLPAYTEIHPTLNNLRRFIVSVNIHESKVNQIKYTVEDGQLNFIISPDSGWFKPEDVTARTGEFKYDLIITIGTPDLESLGPIYDDNIEFFYKTSIINIDHQSANEEFGQINFIDLNAVATAEILFYFLKNYKPELISEDVATCLLTGIIQQTKNFKTTNLTPRTLLTASELITLGARREEIVANLYRTRNIASLKLWGKILNNLQTTPNSELLWSKISAADFQATGATDNDLTDIVDELIASVPSAKVIALLYETAPRQTKVLVYSLKNFNALDLLKEYAPQGNLKLAQASVPQSLAEAETQIIANLRNKLDKLG